MPEAAGFTKTYDRNVAVGHLNLRIEPGDVYGLPGSNGDDNPTIINLYFGFGFRQYAYVPLLRPDHVVAVAPGGRRDPRADHVEPGA